jgi:hypothetical protein
MKKKAFGKKTSIFGKLESDSLTVDKDAKTLPNKNTLVENSSSFLFFFLFAKLSIWSKTSCGTSSVTFPLHKPDARK